MMLLLLNICSLSFFFFFSSRRRHTRWNCDWSSDVCSSDLRFSVSHCVEQEEFFRLDAAEIDGEIQPMNCQKDLRRFKLCNGPDLTAFSSFVHSVAGKIRRVVPVFHFQEQIVHGIVQLEQSHIRLDAQLEICCVHLTEILGAKRGLCLTVEGFDVCPFETNHIEGQLASISYPTRVLAQPRLQMRAQISKCEGA